MFSFFERRSEPFPETRLGAPPKGLARFCWHYVRDAWGWLAALALLTAALAIGEVMLFGFLGRVVDWLASADPQGFLDREGGRLAAMGLLLIVGLPLGVVLQALLEALDAFGEISHDSRNLAAAAKEQKRNSEEDQPVPYAQAAHVRGCSIAGAADALPGFPALSQTATFAASDGPVTLFPG